MQPIEFKIAKRPELELRIKKVSPVDLLAISTQMDFNKFAQTKEMYKFALEQTEVKIGDKWFPVKVEGREVYMPTDLEDDPIALNEIIVYFLDNVVTKVFPESSE